MAIAVDSKRIVADFVRVAEIAGCLIYPKDIEIQECPAPHRPPSSKPKDKQAIYVFMFGTRCLKVGKAGPKSAARFCNHHYGANRALSNLARSMIKRQSNFELADLQEHNVGEWICQKTDRVNFLLPAAYGSSVLSLFEVFVQCSLRPEFEGFESQRVVS